MGMLDYQDISQSIDYFGAAGIVLSSEQKSALQSSLIILKEQNKFSNLYLWGRIDGLNDDYFIAVGCGKNEFSEKKFFYVKAREEKELLMRWKLLTTPSDSDRERFKFIFGRFTGDPSHEFEYTEVIKTGVGDEAVEEEQTLQLKEENRLAVAIENLNDEAVIVPFGAFIRAPTGQVLKNRSWEGLSIGEAAKLSSYFHFRQAVNLVRKNPIDRANLDKATHFMDTIEDDIPKGKWSLQFERGGGVVHIRNLEWPGYVFFHVPNSRKFGSLYWGTGERNLDLPFML